jgi:hypothetical protein
MKSAPAKTRWEEVWRQTPPGSIPKNQIYKGGNVENKIETQKIIQHIITLLGRATDKQLRIIYQVAYEIVKKA